jgi:putative glutamine amidotransferase
VSLPLVLVTSIPRRIETTLPTRRASATVDHRFGDLVTAAGGVLVAADAWSEPEGLVERIDALLINGGSDIDPRTYGAEPAATTDEPDIRRDAFEFGLVRCAIERGMPVLGVCRGMQLVNVCLGGTLTQDLSERTHLRHYVPERFDGLVHDVTLLEGSHAERALGRVRIPVNSIHHQGVDELGNGLRVSARAPDGTIEAIEDESGAVLGIQWHPEFLSEKDATRHIGLFRALVGACTAATGSL